ncbi:MAG: transglycosylase domain-containing protein [Spirochaetes bacterium]|nr:transglycosylase domain-containing protein [Spirochaetota bacterium]
MKLKKRAAKILKILIISIISLIIITCFYMLIVFFEFVQNIDSIYNKLNLFSYALNSNDETDIILQDELKKDDDRQSSFFYDRFGKIIAKYSPEKHMLIPLRRIPFFVSRGFIIVEDNHFFNHHGINYVRTGIAVIKNIITFGRAPGGSTITQQLAKILFTKQKRNIKRKIYELYCAIGIENKFNKNEILQIYLNSIYLGHGIYGIANASQFYFGKDASELTVSEAALLIGMNRAPEIYSPIKNRDHAMNIQKVVLNQFVKEGFLSKDESELEFNRFWKRFDSKGAVGNQSFWKTQINRSGYVTEYIRQTLEKELPFDKITQGGLIVETTIDIERQLLAEKIVRNYIKDVEEKIKKINDGLKNKVLTDEEIYDLESSFASIDYRTGEVLVLLGGSQYSFANQFNRAINAFRPIGSSVKPFIYAMGFNEGKIGDNDFHPFSKFKDEIKTYIVNNKKYEPKNYDINHKYGNIVTIYDAVKTSLNTVSVSVFNEMNDEQKDKVVDFIQKAAFLYSEKDKKRVPKVLSLALGTCELSTLELAAAYSVFCRGGKSLYPIIIKKIYDKKGNVYYDYTRDNNPNFNNLYPKEYRESLQLIRPEAAYEMAQVLRGTFEDGGTGWWASYVTGFNALGYGKSGTSQDFKDAWFAGFTDREVSASWVGLDNNKSMLMPGSSSAALIWCDYNSKIATNISDPIPKPDNMKLVTICRSTGLQAVKGCPEKIDFYFWNDGPLPEKCYIHSDFNF